MKLFTHKGPWDSEGTTYYATGWTRSSQLPVASSPFVWWAAHRITYGSKK